MSKKEKIPLWAGRTFMVPEMESLDWGIIEKKAKISFNSEQRKSLLSAINYYLADYTIEKSTPATSKVNNRLDDIEKHARKLRNALSVSVPEGEIAFNAVWPWEPDFEPRIKPSMFIKLLREIAIRAKEKEAESKPGRRRKEALRDLVLRTHNVWIEAGDKSKGCYFDIHSNSYKGGLFMLVKVLLKQSQDKNLPSDAIIAKIIQE